MAVIGDYAFYGCDGLASRPSKSGLGNVTVGTGGVLLGGLSSTTFEDGSRVTGLGAGAFESCSSGRSDPDASRQLWRASVTAPLRNAAPGSDRFWRARRPAFRRRRVLRLSDRHADAAQKNVTALPNFLGGLSVERIEVDANNPALATVEGVLHAKEATASL